jgi:RNA polymerase sigma-70 factor (ECF subfamily)
VSDPATAQDILRDVFVKIQKRLSQLQDPAKLEGWIYLITRNAIIDHYRTRKQTVEVPTHCRRTTPIRRSRGIEGGVPPDDFSLPEPFAKRWC